MPSYPLFCIWAGTAISKRLAPLPRPLFAVAMLLTERDTETVGCTSGFASNSHLMNADESTEFCSLCVVCKDKSPQF